MSQSFIQSTQSPKHVRSRLFERLSDLSPVLEANQTQIGPGEFRVNGVVAKACDAWLIRNHIGPLSVGHIVPDPRLLAFLVPVAWQNDYYFNGIAATASTLYVSSGGDGYATRGQERDYFTIGLDRARFVTSLAALDGLDPLEIQLNDGALQLHPFSVARLRQILQSYLTELASHGGHSPVRQAEIEEGLYGVMLEAYLAGTPVAEPRTPRALSYERIVRIAEERFASANGSALSLVDLCRATGVGRTVLYDAFSSLFDTPPLAYFKKRRLMMARSTLAASDPKCVQVKQVALSLGLTHLGRFSTEYKALFGEAPSITMETRLSPKPSAF